MLRFDYSSMNNDAVFDWDDLRHFLAVARAGSTLGAARALGASQPTVVRRIAALEAAVGAALFERRRSGYSLTPLGLATLPMAERVEAAVQNIADALDAHCRRLAGCIRVTASESVGNVLLTPAVIAFRRAHPAIEVEIVISDHFLDLARGEADVAIRATTGTLEDSDLVARLLSDAPWAVYCSRAYGETAGIPKTADELACHAVIGGEGAIRETSGLRWLEEVAPHAQVAWRSNSLTNLQAAVRAGLGVSTLPCLIGASDPDLVKCFAAGEVMNGRIWLIVTPEMRKRPHICAFTAALIEHFKANRALIYDEAG